MSDIDRAAFEAAFEAAGPSWEDDFELDEEHVAAVPSTTASPVSDTFTAPFGDAPAFEAAGPSGTCFWALFVHNCVQGFL